MKNGIGVVPRIEEMLKKAMISAQNMEDEVFVDVKYAQK